MVGMIAMTSAGLRTGLTRPAQDVQRLAPEYVHPVHDERWLGEIDRRSDLTVEEFDREYQRPQRPVILTGLMDDWPALRHWSFASLRARLGHHEVPVGRCFGHKSKMRLAEYIDRMHELASQEPGRPPLYMEGWYYRAAAPEIARDYRVLPHFSADLYERPWFPYKVTPPLHALLIGPRGAFTKLHFDLGASHSWNAQILGRKRWVFISPDQMHNCYMETRQVGGYFPGTDIETPDLQRYPRLGKVKYRTGVVHPGEMVWFPSMWLHEVLSLDDAVSVTHNYLNRDILLRALKHHFLAKVLKRRGVG
jgi:hypothetical protein